MVQRVKTTERESEQVKESDFRFQNETKAQSVSQGFYLTLYVMYNYLIMYPAI